MFRITKNVKNCMDWTEQMQENSCCCTFKISFMSLSFYSVFDFEFYFESKSESRQCYNFVQFFNQNHCLNIKLTNQIIKDFNQFSIHKMYEVWIVLFCFMRFIINRFVFNKKHPSSQQSQEGSSKKQNVQSQKKQQATKKQSPLQIQLKQLKDKKQQIESTMQQYNTPSTFAKYSKMQRQLSKLSNQIPALQSEVLKETSNENVSNQTSQNTQNERPSLLEQKKKEIKNIHQQIGNKDLLIKAFTNLGLIILCSYVQSTEISACASYPLYTFCNETGRINGAWIFIFSTIILSH